MATTTAIETGIRTNGSSAPHDTFELVLEAGERYVQSVSFTGETLSPLVMDEPLPMGDGAGPNPARMLGAAVGGCLSASLLFCLRKAHINVTGMTTTVRGTLARNERGRLRVSDIHVALRPMVPATDHMRVTRCAAVFEDYCVVTATVGRAINITVRVEPVAPLP